MNSNYETIFAYANTSSLVKTQAEQTRQLIVFRCLPIIIGPINFNYYKQEEDLDPNSKLDLEKEDIESVGL